MVFVSILTLGVLWLGWCALFISMCKFAQAVHEWLETRRQDRRRVSASSHRQLAVRETEQHLHEVARVLANIETQQGQAIQRIYGAADRALFEIRQCRR